MVKYWSFGRAVTTSVQSEIYSSSHVANGAQTAHTKYYIEICWNHLKVKWIEI